MSGGVCCMISLFRRRAVKAHKPSLHQRPPGLIEPLESRRLLSSDVTVDLRVDHASASYGDLVSFDADVNSLDGPVSGVVSFIDTSSGTTLGQSDIASGTAELALSTLHAGSYSVMAHYEGDPSFNPGDSGQSSLTIDRAVTTAVLDVTGPTTVTLSVNSTAGTPDGGAVTLLEGSNVMGSGTLAAGGFN